MSPPVGPAGCESSGKPSGESPWLVSAAASTFATEIRFSAADLTYHVSEQTLAAALGRRFGDRFSLRALGGGILDGFVQRDGERFDVDAGWLAGLSFAGNWSHIDATDWFFGASVTVAISSTHTTDRFGSKDHLTAQDNRLSLIFGRIFAERWSPYILARGFGGPVFWTVHGADVTGSDTHHYAVGFGGNFAIVPGIDVFAEEAVLGERSLTVGGATSF